MVARFARLFPLYFFIVVIGLMEHAKFGSTKIALSFLSMTQSWVGLQSQVASIELTWSVSTEWFFYFVFMLAGGELVRLWNLGIWRKTIYVVSFIGIIAHLLTFAYQPALAEHMKAYLDRCFHYGDLANSSRWFSYFSPYLRVLEFASGTLCALFFLFFSKSKEKSDTSERHVFFVWMWLGIWLALMIADANLWLASLHPFFGYLRQNSLYTLPIVMFMYFSSVAPNTVTWLNLPLMAWMGERSFSIYLSQFFGTRVYNLLAFITIGESAWWTAMAKLLALIILLAIIAELMHRTIDTPFRKWIKKYFLRSEKSERRKLKKGQ